jgi:hypothetical protein
MRAAPSLDWASTALQLINMGSSGATMLTGKPELTIKTPPTYLNMKCETRGRCSLFSLGSAKLATASSCGAFCCRMTVSSTCLQAFCTL